MQSPIVINIRGTGGSGKTTLARAIMSAYGPPRAVYREGRKKPIGYVLPHPDGGRDLAVIGHYETACGGCDTISDTDLLFGEINGHAECGRDVLFEGLLVSGEVNRTLDLARKYPVHVIRLDTTLEQCIANIRKRRAERGDDRPLKTDNTTAKHKCVKSACYRLGHLAKVHYLSADAAFELAISLTGVKRQMAA